MNVLNMPLFARAAFGKRALNEISDSNPWFWTLHHDYFKVTSYKDLELPNPEFDIDHGLDFFFQTAYLFW